MILAKLAIEAGLPPGVLNIVRLRLPSSLLRSTLAPVHFVAPLVCLHSLLPPSAPCSAVSLLSYCLDAVSGSSEMLHPECTVGQVHAECSVY